MADPVISNGIRAQLILQGRSGLPEDSFVTTWAFLRGTGVAYADAHTYIATILEQFITGTAPNGDELENFLGPAVLRGEDAGIVKTYDLGQSTPRQPTETRFNVTGSVPTTGLPAEVALTGSFYSFRNLPRQRGRIYFGPLTPLAVEVQSGTGRVKPGTGIINALSYQLSELRQSGLAAGVTWCVLSQADMDLKPVTAGWVDDAFDTQRRRGEDPQSRVTWGGEALP